MITQYRNSNGGYGLPSSSYLNYFKNYIMPTDDYLIMQEDEYTYVCLIDRIIGDDYEDAFELKQRLNSNLNRINNAGNISYLSKYIISQII